MARVGLDKIGVYLPQMYINHGNLRAERGFNDTGLGFESLSVPDLYDDPISMAANAAESLGNYDRERVGRLVVATESNHDSAKPIANYVHELIGLPENTETFEVKHACAAGSHALGDALNWIRIGQNKGRDALIICSDIARYEKGSSAELTQGAGAVALLVSDNPGLIEFDEHVGTYSKNFPDFFRTGEFPEVNGKLSVKAYNAALRGAYRDYGHKGIKDMDYLVCHTPFPSLVKKALRSLSAKEGIALESIEEKIKDSLQAPSRVGNIYTGSLFLALNSLLERKGSGSLGLYGFGSGCSGRFYSGHIIESAEPRLGSMLDQRMEIDANQYDEIVYSDSNSPLTFPKGFFLSDVAGNERHYQRAEDLVIHSPERDTSIEIVTTPQEGYTELAQVNTMSLWERAKEYAGLLTDTLVGAPWGFSPSEQYAVAELQDKVNERLKRL